MDKTDSAYKTIGEVVKILKLKSNNKGILPTHTIRYWEKQFKQVALELDEIANNSIKADNLKNKLTRISKIIKNLKELK